MKNIIVVSAFTLIWNIGFAQTCVTQDLDSRSPEVKEGIERQLAETDGSSARSVTYVQTVVHVLWSSANDNISDSVVQANIDLVNKDLRRQNADTSETPDHFLTVAADTEIELRLAQVDPNGQPTNGITHTYTDSTEFYYEFGHMKYDSTGGKTAWDTENYLNIWVVRRIAIDVVGGGTTLGVGTLPSFTPNEEKGLVIRKEQFGSGSIGWRTITHEFGHFACLIHPESIDTCYDADMVSDTPIGQPALALNCGDTVITCNNGPNGNMHQNFMSYNNLGCSNIFTQGQKDRMLNCLETQYPGLLQYRFLGVDELVSNRLEVFPNPTRNTISFDSKEKGNLSVLDMRGRTVLTLAASKGKNAVEVSSLPKGIYLLRLETEQAFSSARFVKN